MSAPEPGILITPGGQVTRTGPAAWRLEIPPGPAGRYRLAQLDDYHGLRRSAFPHAAPYRFELQARASSAGIPGTWGFGLWNDPFSLGFSGKGNPARLPTLPNAAWFFYAAPPGYLSLHEDQPAQGWLAQVLRGPRRPVPWLALGTLLSPLLLLPPAARWLRRSCRRLVGQQSTKLAVDPTDWHSYCLDWRSQGVTFLVDGLEALATEIAPRPALGLVIWVDNQVAAWRPDGRLAWETLASSEAAWIEIRGLKI